MVLILSWFTLTFPSVQSPRNTAKVPCTLQLTSHPLHEPGDFQSVVQSLSTVRFSSSNKEFSLPLFLCLPLIYPMCATCDLLQAPCDVFFHKRLFITQKLTDYITVSMKGDTARRTLFLFLKVFRTRWSQFNESQEKKINKTKTCPSGYVTFPAHSKIISLFLGILHSAKEVFIIKIRGLIYFL